MGQLGNYKGIWKWGYLRLSVVTFFFPSQAKKTKSPIFHLWQERMGGCFFKKFPLILVWHWLVGLASENSRWMMLDEFPEGKEVTFFKDVIWLLALLPTLKANPRTSDEDVLLWGVLCVPLPGWGLLWYSLSLKGSHVWGPAMDSGVWVSISVHSSVKELISLLYFISTKGWSSVPILPASMAGSLTLVMAGSHLLLG